MDEFFLLGQLRKALMKLKPGHYRFDSGYMLPTGFQLSFPKGLSKAKQKDLIEAVREFEAQMMVADVHLAFAGVQVEIGTKKRLPRSSGHAGKKRSRKGSSR